MRKKLCHGWLIHDFQLRSFLTVVLFAMALRSNAQEIVRLPSVGNSGMDYRFQALTNCSSAEVEALQDFPPPSEQSEQDTEESYSCSTSHRNTGFIDLNYYWDNRGFNVITINSGAKLPKDFEYFQLLNLSGDVGEPSERGDWTNFYTEINLRRPICKDHPAVKSWDLNVQLADGSIPEEVLRLGMRWPNIAIRAFPKALSKQAGDLVSSMSSASRDLYLQMERRVFTCHSSCLA